MVECDAEQAAEPKVWLEKVMTEGMEAALNSTDEGCLVVAVEGRIAGSRGEGG
jgi:hypothetical protein